MDLHKISRLKVWTMLPFMWFRFFAMYFFMFIQCVTLMLVSLSTSSDQYHGWRHFIIKWACTIEARILFFTCGVWPGLFTQERRYFDYSKYLGPDWKPSHDGASSVCCNHQSWLDIIVMMYNQPPSHVAKEGTKNIPGVGYISKAAGCLYLDRDSNAKVRNKGLQDKIIKR